mgnify:CR=1 FL=1
MNPVQRVDRFEGIRNLPGSRKTAPGVHPSTPSGITKSTSPVIATALSPFQAPAETPLLNSPQLLEGLLDDLRTFLEDRSYDGEADSIDISSSIEDLVVHPDGTFFVHETYYDDREGVLGIAREPARPCGEAASDVHDELKRMAEGLQERPLRLLDYAPETPSGPSGDGAGGGAPSLN